MEAADYSRRRFPAETRRMIAAKLVRGRESTAQLQFLLQSATGTDHHRRALAAEILSCFTEVIRVLDSSESAGNDISCPDHSLCSDLDSGNSRRSPAVKDLGRGNKRRRLANTRIVKSATMEDGHAWRKYGQKVILNTEHPRSYFRCTHKYDQRCGATKQVQKMDGNSEMYRITYISNHTCSAVGTSAVVAETPPSASDSYNICFSDCRSDQLGESSGCCLWASNEGAAKGGETTSGMTDEMDVWSVLNDIESLQGTTTMASQYDFLTADNVDVDSSRMFWGSVLQ